MGRGLSGWFKTGRDTLGVGPVRVGGHSVRFGTGRETLGEVWDGLEDPREGPRRFGGPTRRSGRVGGP